MVSAASMGLSPQVSQPACPPNNLVSMVCEFSRVIGPKFNTGMFLAEIK